MTVYDTREGISAATASLSAFASLIRDRREAGYTRGERLQEWIVGALWLDAAGNAGVITDPVVAARHPYAVQARAEFFATLPENASVTTKLRPIPLAATCPECICGWSLETIAAFVVVADAFLHVVCHKQREQREEAQRLRDAFGHAGVRILSMAPVANRYCPCDTCPPWFEVETAGGVVVVGWRKRVVELDYSRVDPTNRFPRDDATNGPGYVHCWSYGVLTGKIRDLLGGGGMGD